MVLTEPDAGSDVGAGRTRAIPQPDGSCILKVHQAFHHFR
jgi:alkylation response protein AidB-like acyl-CoA dehydrogenase